MDAIERCLPAEVVLLKETKKFLAYQELYSWQENMGLYDCDTDYLKSLAELTNCQHFEDFGQEAMTTLVEGLFLKFQKALAVAQKELKPPVSQPSAAAATALASSTASAPTMAPATTVTTITSEVAARKGLETEPEADDDDTPKVEETKPGGKKFKKAKKTKAKDEEEEAKKDEDKVVKILPNLIIVPPGGKPPAGTLNTPPVTVPKVLPKILPKPLYGNGLSMPTSVPGTTNIVAKGIEDLSCHICSKIFSDKNKLWKHIRLHNRPKNHICPNCGEGFYEKYQLTEHSYVHTGIKPYKCGVCGAEYQSLSSYTSHKRTHTETGLVCRFCGRACKNKRTLTNHENIHTGGISKDSKKYFLLVKEKEAAPEEKIHPCELCGEKFAFKNSLSYHVMINHHTFVCSKCGKSFATKQGMELHAASHEKPENRERKYECPVCHKSYLSYSSLRTHKEIHMGKTFTCKVCHKTYGRPSDLRNHAAIHNPSRAEIIRAKRKERSRKQRANLSEEQREQQKKMNREYMRRYLAKKREQGQQAVQIAHPQQQQQQQQPQQHQQTISQPQVQQAPPQTQTVQVQIQPQQHNGPIIRPVITNPHQPQISQAQIQSLALPLNQPQQLLHNLQHPLVLNPPPLNPPPLYRY